MRIVIASNLDNGIGLERDFVLLRDFLVSRDHEVYGQHYTQPAAEGTYDLGIFLETIAENLVPMASRWFYIANPEWLKPEFVRPIQRHCEKVIAKTRAAEKALRGTFSSVHYTGFLTADKGDPKIKRERKFLHIGGNSGMRGTNAVIEAWREYRYWDDVELPELTVVSNSKETAEFEDTLGIRFIKRATDEQIKELQNSCLYHLMPSAYEGFGHALHESQSVGAILLTTDAEPMTDLKAPFEVKPFRERKVNFGVLHDVAPLTIRETVPKMLALPNYEIARMRTEARLRFKQGNKEFAERFDGLLEDRHVQSVLSIPCATPDFVMAGGSKNSIPQESKVKKLRIAMLGNFHPPHSTENDWAWSFESLGHKVTKFQENEDTTDDVLSFCISNEVNLFLYVHTHSWITPGKLSLDEMLKKLRKAGIPSASPHLDLYFGLNNGDGRERNVGKHPFWHTDICMTADGSSQDKFSACGVNHSWLRPGVVARDCYFGTPDPELAIDIAFCGAVGYHSEWPWRGEMIHNLRAIYGDRFKVFNGFRGKRLNDLYASVKILIGDCCFAGKPKYYSDRWPESCGRGGFLLAPQVEGCCIPTATFIPQDIHDLADKIDYYLSHDEERELIRRAAHEHVKAHDTYTHRAGEILRIFNL